MNCVEAVSWRVQIEKDICFTEIKFYLFVHYLFYLKNLEKKKIEESVTRCGGKVEIFMAL